MSIILHDQEPRFTAPRRSAWDVTPTSYLQRVQLAQSVLGHADDLTDREARVLAILRGEVGL